MERSVIRDRRSPDYGEFIIGPAEGRTRWLHRGYISASAPTGRRLPMKELIRQYLDDGVSRRQLMTGLSALGMSTAAATAMAQSLSPVSAAPPNGVRNAMRDVQGTGGALFVAQLKAAGVKYVFFNPSTGDYPIFDALVDEPDIQVIKGIHEDAVVAMADAYARATCQPV